MAGCCGDIGRTGLQAINKSRTIAAKGFSPKVIWGVVKAAASACGLQQYQLASHLVTRNGFARNTPSSCPLM